MGLTDFSHHTLVFYRKNQLQFFYYQTLPRLRYPSRVFCSRRLFLYPYMITSPAFSRLLPFKHTLYCLTFILYLPPIVTFCLPCSYGAMHLDRVLPCLTWIGFFTLLVLSIFYSLCLGSLLFDKYYQHVYKSQNAGFIYCCLYQTLGIAIKSTIL